MIPGNFEIIRLPLSALNLDEEDIHSAKELEEGIEISDAMKHKISVCIQAILSGERVVEGVSFFKSQETHRVFVVNDFDHYVFKVGVSSLNPLSDPSLDYMNVSMLDRYKKMLRGRTAIRTHHLSRLVVPHIACYKIPFKGGECELLVEERLKLTSFDKMELSQRGVTYQKAVEEALIHLAHFICLTDYSDVARRNMPFLEEGSEEKKIALIDLEEMEGALIGIFGHAYVHRKGLIRSVPKSLEEKIKEVAESHGLHLESAMPRADSSELSFGHCLSITSEDFVNSPDRRKMGE